MCQRNSQGTLRERSNVLLGSEGFGSDRRAPSTLAVRDEPPMNPEKWPKVCIKCNALRC